jgi:hypothetical protein
MQPTADPNLVAGWIALANSDSGTPEHDRHFWAFDGVYRMRWDAAQTWSFILAVLAADQSNRVLEVLSAGPLEDYLVDHGPTVIDAVEREASINPSFASLLGGVWQNSMSAEVWQRVQAVRDRRGWDGNPAA